ncbi:hypothetical protein ACV3PA_02715 [Exiguobacterium acetylicum]
MINRNELSRLERELIKDDVELFSEFENVDISTLEGRKVFECMCQLINTKHVRLAAIQEIPLSQVAKWQIEDGSCSGGEMHVESSSTVEPSA